MQKVLFRCRFFEVRVKEVLIVLLVLILLFFLFKSCSISEQEKQNQLKKEARVEDICPLTNNNISNFEQLLYRADLCSESWYRDLKNYIESLQNQNKYLEKSKKKNIKYIFKAQVSFLDYLYQFYEEKDDKSVEKLQKAYYSYVEAYTKVCKDKEGL